MTKDIREYTKEELKALLAEAGEPAYRAKQLFSRLHAKRAGSYDEMSELPKGLREFLKAQYPICHPALRARQQSAADGTVKFLFALSDGTLVECVLMRYRFGISLCVSSQAGCDMGCSFCASAIGGSVRSLTASEMLSQVYEVMALTGEEVKRVVVMGSGEPFHNYDAVVRFLSLLSDEDGMHLSRRHLTVSTCGIVPKIEAFAKDMPQVNLAVSLHAPTQSLRETIMPVAKAYPLPLLIETCRNYVHGTGRQITFEYALMHGVNDGEKEAQELASLVRGIDCVINLIPVNPVRENDFEAPDKTHVRDFKINLEKSGINVTIRREMGRDIDGACGQLRRRFDDR